ncbi:hypothetical protein FOZ60_010284 [Perkinsus olseni]|uniref:Uncharacterized protein n=1 Tax=Perkinsus olseni TaxID=32597 RepID=A0A7J6NFE4_PEROL|nr:hypothetical protein FOZ60_010284 [Perkinsus olseni]
MKTTRECPGTITAFKLQGSSALSHTWTSCLAERRGSSIETESSHGSVEYPIKYEKVDGRNGQPGYFDVNFTDYDGPRRFYTTDAGLDVCIPLRGDLPPVGGVRRASPDEVDGDIETREILRDEEEI